jgi:TPR repeat protein
MARARQLVEQGNISAARSMLERAVEGGNARAIFALAETYDSNMLSTWGTVGVQGDFAKAKGLYGKALAGGVEEADARLKALRP